MATILTSAATFKCMHGFKIPATNVSNQKLKIGGDFALLPADASTWVPACTDTNTPCVSVSVTAAGQSKLKVSGSAVISKDFVGTTNAGTMSVSGGPTKLTAS